ncbi:MAG: DNA cytosine methyltransferase [Acidobacteriia bacterium]|nr:DNA cytosine methyltransferase [Terriglobia bacterium]
MPRPRKPSRSRSYTALDLFSGCGGLTTGLKRAGFRVLGAVENDPVSARTYRSNHPAVHIWQEDIRDVRAKTLLQDLRLKRGELDLLAACPPCQAFSTMRTLNRGRRIIARKEKDLLTEVMRFVRVLLPRTVMVENVPGLACDRRWLSLVAKLRKLGFFSQYRVLNAADFGVPQRRKRLILLASRLGPVNFALPEPERATVKQTIGSLPKAGRSRDSLHNIPERRNPGIKTLISLIPKDGGSRGDLEDSLQLPCHHECNGFRDVYGRMKWDDVAPTITSGCTNPSKGRFLHPQENRSITLREAALLQSFPKSYRFHVRDGKSAIAAMIGNALPPEFISRHARELRKVTRDCS